MFGAVTLFYAFVIFISAHLIAPDPTPNAGFQMNEIAFKSPGFHITVLKVPLEIQHKNQFFKWLISGKELSYRLIPIKNYWMQSDSLLVERYLGDGIAGDTLHFPVQQIISDFNASDKLHQIEKNAISNKYFYLEQMILVVIISAECC